MTLFVLLQSDAATSMTSCCIFRFSGISCITASVLAVTLRVEDLGLLQRSTGKGLPAEMLHLLKYTNFAAFLIYSWG